MTYGISLLSVVPFCQQNMLVITNIALCQPLPSKNSLSKPVFPLRKARSTLSLTTDTRKKKPSFAPVQLSAYKPSQLLVHFPRISPFITLWDCVFRAFIQHNTHLEPHSKPSGKIKRSFHLKFLLWRCSPVTCHCWLSPAKADSSLWAWRRALKCELHKAGRLRAADNLFMQDPGPEGSWNSQQAVMNLSLSVN